MQLFSMFEGMFQYCRQVFLPGGPLERMTTGVLIPNTSIQLSKTSPSVYNIMARRRLWNLSAPDCGQLDIARQYSVIGTQIRTCRVYLQLSLLCTKALQPNSMLTRDLVSCVDSHLTQKSCLQPKTTSPQVPTKARPKLHQSSHPTADRA